MPKAKKIKAVKKTGRQKNGKGKKPAKKNGSPAKDVKLSVSGVSPEQELSTKLQWLEEKLGFLAKKAENSRTKRLGITPRLRFFLSSEGKIEGYLIYNSQKVYKWGEVKGNTFRFIYGVHANYLPSEDGIVKF